MCAVRPLPARRRCEPLQVRGRAGRLRLPQGPRLPGQLLLACLRTLPRPHGSLRRRGPRHLTPSPDPAASHRRHCRSRRPSTPMRRPPKSKQSASSTPAHARFSPRPPSSSPSRSRSPPSRPQRRPRGPSVPADALRRQFRDHLGACCSNQKYPVGIDEYPIDIDGGL